MSIFKAYDIRGVYPDEINEEVAYKIGRATVEFLGCKKMTVGMDIRKSSPAIAKAFINGVIDQGCDVINIGVSTTPMLYFAGRKTEACAMITASHNPKEYNGIKICTKDAMPVFRENGLPIIEKMTEEESYKEPEYKGLLMHADVKEEYVNFALSKLTHKKKFKIVVDTGNGSGGITYKELKRKAENLEIVPMYFEPNGEFPNHEANPSKRETLKELQERVVLERADFGVALDGDADRCVFIDEKGNIIRPDILLAVIAHEILMEHPKETVLVDLRASRVVKEAIESAKGKVKTTRVGHSYIKENMRKENAILAGELSGHYFFREVSYCENTMLVLAEVCKAIERTGNKLSVLTKPLEEVYANTGEITITTPNKAKALERVEEEYSDGKIDKTDGLKVEYEEWWFSLRPSNTEPVMRLVIEGKEKSKIEKEKERIIHIAQHAV